MMEKLNSNKPIFDGKEQRKIIHENYHLTKRFLTVKNVDEWNDMRKQVKREFVGTQEQCLMLFGYIDGVVHSEVFGK